MATFDEFLTSYGAEISKEIKRFRAIAKQIKEVGEMTATDIEMAYEAIDRIYDSGVADKFEGWLHNPMDLTSTELARMALNNMNRYGTEMRMAIFALEEFNNKLRDYDTTEEEDDE